MALFKYKIADSSGKISELLIEGDNKSDSLQRVKSRGFTPVKCMGEVEDFGEKKSIFSKKSDFNVYSFTNRLAPLLEAHISLEKSFAIIADNEKNETGKLSIVNEMRKGLHEGKKFSALVRGYGSHFPNIYANLIEAGEESGALSSTIKELQCFMNDQKETRDFLITSSIYPAVILSVVLGVGILLFTVFIPKFADIFADTGKELPAITAFILSLSEFMTTFWWIWPILIIGIIFFIKSIKKGGRMKEWFDDIILKAPIVGKLIETSEVSKFIRTLSVLIQNHVHILKAVEISSKVIQNTTISLSFAGISSELRAGAKLSNALVRSPYMPKEALQMLEIGEESGEVGEMLGKASEHFERDTKVRIKRLLALFEPVVILIMAVVVLVVVLSVFLAMIEMGEL